jgi:eukaryotic-like serine/threonine-protein kinase
MLRQFLTKLRGSRQATVPGYVLADLIRDSSMSMIYKATEEQSGRVVAIKFPKSDARKALEKVESRYRDFSEGQITSAVQHPNVVACLDHGRIGEESYLVMEFLEGTTLGVLRQRQSNTPVMRSMEILLRGAEALAHVHSKGFIHHDFCCRNLFVTNGGDVKLIDFGLATPTVKTPVPGVRVGTTEVLAPEVLRREPSDHRVDIFSWGVVAYEVLCGHWPFESPEQHQALNKILNVNPVPLARRGEGVPEEVSNLVMRCIEKDPERRLGTLNPAVGVMRRHCQPAS